MAHLATGATFVWMAWRLAAVPSYISSALAGSESRLAAGLAISEHGFATGPLDVAGVVAPTLAGTVACPGGLLKFVVVTRGEQSRPLALVVILLIGAIAIVRSVASLVICC